MHILVTNDDGIFAPGILALQAALRRIEGATVTVMAPNQNQSAVGHRKTMRDPLRIDEVTLKDSTPGHACSGSPADAIALALMGYIEEPVDIVVSGINLGGNLAQDITYSGTVTAAMEAAIFGLPAIAISLDTRSDPDFDAAARFAAWLTPVVLAAGLPELTLLNVNVPARKVKGVEITRQGRRRYHDCLIKWVDPTGRPYYWIGGDRPTGDTEEVGTNVWAVAQGYISISPIRLDMTEHNLIPNIKAWGLAISANGKK